MGRHPDLRETDSVEVPVLLRQVELLRVVSSKQRVSPVMPKERHDVLVPEIRSVGKRRERMTKAVERLRF